jgi:N-acetylglucosaminyl-diphospho-decaprenol L-rhamnosyltransferase
MLVNGRMMAELGGMDEDFFLYHEEVAFSRSAQDRGWRVEFDPGVCLVHRHPLQNRSISPKMRVIIRHSKLLYFRKHLPRWQFLGLSWIVAVEAAVRGAGSRVLGPAENRRAWRAIGKIARRLRVGETVLGGDVLRMARAVERGEEGPAPAGAGPLRDLDRLAVLEEEQPVAAGSSPER